MRRYCFFWLTLVLFHPSAFAGHIYGRLWFGGKSLPPKQSVTIQCGKDKPLTSVTDNNGAYRFFIKSTGKCLLTVNHAKRLFTMDVFSYSQPTSYDWDLATDGSQSVKRR